MDPTKEAEERLGFLEGRDKKIGDSEIRSHVLLLYADMLKGIKYAHTNASLTENDKCHLVMAYATLFKQEASIVMGENQTQCLFGADNDIDAYFLHYDGYQ